MLQINVVYFIISAEDPEKVWALHLFSILKSIQVNCGQFIVL